MCSAPYHVGYSAGVLEAEVGAEVDHEAVRGEQVGHQLLGRAVGQPAEHDVEVVASATPGSRRLEHEVGIGDGQARVQVGDAGAGLGVPGGDDEVERRVLRAQPQQLGPGEAGGADDADPATGGQGVARSTTSSAAFDGPACLDQSCREPIRPPA